MSQASSSPNDHGFDSPRSWATKRVAMKDGSALENKAGVDAGKTRMAKIILRGTGRQRALPVDIVDGLSIMEGCGQGTSVAGIGRRLWRAPASLRDLHGVCPPGMARTARLPAKDSSGTGDAGILAREVDESSRPVLPDQGSAAALDGPAPQGPADPALEKSSAAGRVWHVTCSRAKTSPRLAQELQMDIGRVHSRLGNNGWLISTTVAAIHADLRAQQADS